MLFCVLLLFPSNILATNDFHNRDDESGIIINEYEQLKELSKDPRTVLQEKGYSEKK